MAIRIVIADDHTVVRQGLRMFLGLDPELEVVGEANDGAEALQLARQLRPDVVIMDLLMPVMSGIEATAAIRRELPDTEVLALTSVLEDASVVGAVRAGAIGYLLKDTQADALCQAIKAAAAGQVQLTPKAAARLMQAVSAYDNPEELTERETEVFLRKTFPASLIMTSTAIHLVSFSCLVSITCYQRLCGIVLLRVSIRCLPGETLLALALRRGKASCNPCPSTSAFSYVARAYAPSFWAASLSLMLGMEDTSIGYPISEAMADAISVWNCAFAGSPLAR
jgi:two-component system, NarL family, response regulator LiaR